jgi:hypothetical protein
MDFMILRRAFKIFLFLLILLSLYLCAYPVLHNDVGYNEDIARDLLILQNITTTHKLTLIGPRTEAIGGLYHGPLWAYINLPAFIIGQGNPVSVGWFWIMLIACLTSLTYFVGKKIVNPTAGLLAAALVTIYSVQYADSLLNPFGALLFSSLFFYYFYKYIQSTKIIYLLISFFLIGILIQFEIAFGLPMLILSLLYLIPYLYKRKKLLHFFSIIILVVPLSTYVLFDIRHNFLQLHSIINHFGISAGDHRLTPIEMFQTRINGLVSSLFALANQQLWISIIMDVIYAFILIKVYLKKNFKNRQFYFLFTYFYLGYWPLSLYINGYVLTYHVLPFLPVALIILTSGYRLISKWVFAIAFTLILITYYIFASNQITGLSSNMYNNNNSWQFNFRVAKNVYSEVKSSFGYYIFFPDDLGYASRYAMTYTQKFYPHYTANPNIKMPITMLILAPTDNGPNSNRIWWIKNRVRINKAPRSVINYANGYKVEEYILTDEEIKVPSDPNLVNGLFFR